MTKVIIPSFSSLSRFVLARYRFTQIAVDAQIKTPGGKTYDVIFVGTGESRVRIRRFFFCVRGPGVAFEQTHEDLLPRRARRNILLLRLRSGVRVRNYASLDRAQEPKRFGNRK